MIQMLASLVVGMSVKDEAFKAGMATARAEAKKTGQDFDRSGEQMSGAMNRAAQQVNAAAVKIVDSVANIGREVRNAGLALTAGLTLPMGALGHAAKNTASDFQTAMNKVKAAMVGADPAQIEKLRNAALDLGPAFGRSATETAGAIEALAKNGMDASAILGGGLQSALRLAAVGQADLGAASDATTDILQQFHLSTGQLPGVVNKVSGALDASKLSFDGYKDAIGQVGGIAGGLGYQFDDMNTALAAVIPLMTGGSDAGTSFKTFLLSLVPQSKDAADVMDKLGISFFDASGNAKSLSSVAEILNASLSGLNEKSRQTALTKMFGTDGMRVALALMQAGAKGIADVQAQIDKASADEKMAILLDGEAAATQRLASAWEHLGIKIGEAGIIQAYTAIKEAGAGMLTALGSAPPWFYKLAVAVGVAAASLGPLILAGTTVAKLVLPLLLLRLGPVALGFSALINPVGVLLRLLGALALQAGATTLLARLGTTLVGVAGPVGLLITSLAILVPAFQRMSQLSGEYASAQDALNNDLATGRDVTMQLASATGKARVEALAAAKALRVQRTEALATAKAMLVAARANYQKQRGLETSGAAGTTVGTVLGLVTGRNRQGAARDLVAADGIYRARMKELAGLDQAIAAAGKAPGSGTNVSFDDDPSSKKKTGKSAANAARDAARNEAQFQEDLGQSRVAQLQAQADLTGAIGARYKADMASIAEERASYARQLAVDDTLTAAKRAQLLAAKDAELATREQIADQARFNAVAEQSAEIARASNDAQQDVARAAIDLADSASGRRDGELRLLELQRQQEEADLDLILATKNSATAEWQNAQDRKGRLDAIYAQRSDAVARQNEGPADAYLRELNRSAGAISEDIEAVKVDALKGLNRDLADAIMNTRSLGDAFANMGKRIVTSLLEIAIQQRVIKPLAESLFGESDQSGGGRGIGGLLSGLFGGRSGGLSMPGWSSSGTPIVPDTRVSRFGGSILGDLSKYAGALAGGGGVRANEWAIIGEEGPEIWAPGVSGTVIPNGGRGAGPSRGGIAQIVPSAYFDVVVDGRVVRGATPIAASATAQGMAGVQRTSAIRGRQSLA
jgi:TP901 family phage tail tape measure protein